MTETHKRWRIPFVARGAYSETGGHFKAFGFVVSWLPVASWRPTGLFEISFLRLIAVRREEGWQLGLCGFDFRAAIKPATSRYGIISKTVERRAHRKKFEAALRASRVQR